MKHNKNKRKHCGAALVLAVTMVIILALIGTGLIRLGHNARMQAVKDVMQISARSAADAGIEHAVRYMIDGWNGETDKPDWVENTWYDATVWTDPAIPATELGYSFGPVDLGGTYGDASFTYDIYKGTRLSGYQIVSTGTAGGRTRIVHAAVVLRSVFFGIGAKEDIYISPNMDLGTVPDGDTFIVQTNSTEENAITLKPNLVIPGDVIIGPGGDTDISIYYRPNKVDIEGEAKAAEDYIDFPPIYPPSYPVGTWDVDATDPNIARISSNMTLDGGLTLDAGDGGVDTLYIEGYVKIFVNGDTYLPAWTKIIVTAGSTLKLYMGGNLMVMPNSEIKYGEVPVDKTDNDAIVEAAKAISLIGTVDLDGTPLCTEVHFQPMGDFFGSIYAPDAAVELWPGGDFYGAVIGGESIELKPGGTFMFVTELYEYPEIEVLYMGIKKGSWWEE